MRSIFIKCLMVMALATALVAVGLGLFSFGATSRFIEDATRKRAMEVTTLVGGQTYGAIRFGKADAIEAQVEAVRENAGGVLLGGMAMNGEGAVLTVIGETGEAEAAMAALAEEAIAGGTLASSPDGMIVAAPALSPKDGGVGGALVLHWTMAPLAAVIRTAQVQALAVAGGLFALAMVAAAFVLRGMVTRPLERVSAAMGRVAGRDYAVAIPATGRHDEIGQIANTLDAFRAGLQEAETDARIAAFKGAGFDASSAAIMISDEGGIVSFVNGSFEDLTRDLSGLLGPALPGVSLERLVGTDLRAFRPVLREVLDALRDPAQLPKDARIELGEHRLRVWANRIEDTDGTVLGHVFEWQDVTADWLNAKILDTLDQSQVRAEFTVSGRFLCANPSFRALVGEPGGGSGANDLSRLFGLRGKGDDCLEAVKADGQVHGQFILGGGSGVTHILEGGFTLIRDEANRPLRILFLGNDVTRTQTAIAEAEDGAWRMAEDQARMAEQQAGIVAALRDALGALSGGDLARQIAEPFPGEHESLRADFNGAVGSLSEAIALAIDNALHIRESTGEISTAMNDLSSRTERQAATLEETAAALEEMTASVKQSADGAQDARRMVEQARQSADESGEIVAETVAAMAEIKDSSNEIQRIITVINDIAFQTNLLALNAGVEAARAGDAGKGFAVVASEVRQLAQRSSESAAEIETLLTKSRAQVEKGVNRVAETRNRLEGIIGAVATISERVADIATSAEEQSVGLGEINSGVNELDRVTQSNAAMFEETTAATQSLTELAHRLEAAMGRFRTGPQNEAATADASPFARHG